MTLRLLKDFLRLYRDDLNIYLGLSGHFSVNSENSLGIVLELLRDDLKNVLWIIIQNILELFKDHLGLFKDCYGTFQG